MSPGIQKPTVESICGSEYVITESHLYTPHGRELAVPDDFNAELNALADEVQEEMTELGFTIRSRWMRDFDGSMLEVDITPTPLQTRLVPEYDARLIITRRWRKGVGGRERVTEIEFRTFYIDLNGSGEVKASGRCGTVDVAQRKYNDFEQLERDPFEGLLQSRALIQAVLKDYIPAWRVLESATQGE